MHDTAAIARDRGHGPVLVLLHAFPLDHRAWGGGALEGLEGLEDRLRVIAIDLPGFGDARIPSAPQILSMDAMAAAVAAALDAARARPDAVAGNSMGGYVALALAQARPDLVPALALVDSRARADNAVERAGRESLIAALAEAGGSAPALLAERMMPRLLSPAAPAAVTDAVRRLVLASDPAACIAALRGMAARPGLEEFLAGFPGPVLALGGSADPVTPPAELVALAASARDGAAVIVEDAGHLPHLEQPRRVRDHLFDFVSRGARRPAV